MEQNILPKRENFTAVDLAKFILAFFVISIHTCYNFFDNSVANTVINSVIIRIAVPFFFVASGFFFFRDIVFENGRIKKCPENRAKLFGFLKRTFLLYIVWAVIYFAFEAFTYIDADLPLALLCKTYLFAFFLEGFSGHFWYLIFMVYAIVILYLLLRFLKKEIVGVIVGILFAVFLYGYTYRVNFQADFLSSAITSLMMVELSAFGKYFNFYLVYIALGFLFAGLMCVCLREKISKKLSGILTLVSFALSLTENILMDIFLYKPSYRTSTSYSFFLLPLAVFGFIFLSKVKLRGNNKIFAFFRKASSFIYCSHVFVLMVFNFFTDRRFVDKPILFAIISVSTLALTLIIVPLSDKLKFLRKLY